MNNYENLESEYEDKSLSSKQLKIIPESDLSEMFKRIDSKIEF